MSPKSRSLSTMSSIAAVPVRASATLEAHCSTASGARDEAEPDTHLVPLKMRMPTPDMTASPILSVLPDMMLMFLLKVCSANTSA